MVPQIKASKEAYSSKPKMTRAPVKIELNWTTWAIDQSKQGAKGIEQSIPTSGAQQIDTEKNIHKLKIRRRQFCRSKFLTHVWKFITLIFFFWWELELNLETERTGNEKWKQNTIRYYALCSLCYSLKGRPRPTLQTVRFVCLILQLILQLLPVTAGFCDDAGDAVLVNSWKEGDEEIERQLWPRKKQSLLYFSGSGLRTVEEEEEKGWVLAEWGNECWWMMKDERERERERERAKRLWWRRRQRVRMGEGTNGCPVFQAFWARNRRGRRTARGEAAGIMCIASF